MTRRQTIITVVLALLIFTGFVLARFPASQALALAARFNSMLIPHNASGTVWNGKADNLYISYNNQMLETGKTQWTLSPWSLLLGKVNLQLSANAGDQRIKAHVKAGFNTVTVTDAEIHMDVKRILALYPLPVRLEGMIDLTLQEAALNRSGVTALNGNLVIRDMVFTFQRPVTLGTYGARLGMDGSYIRAEVSDIDATVAVQGTVMASLAERQYRNKLQINPTPVADMSVGQTLNMVAKKQDDGSFLFEQNGRF